MKKFLLVIFILIVAETFLTKCANPGAPTGGPKDTIPPTLLSSYPEDQTLNFNDQTLRLTFDEFIAADKLKQSLIITPTLDNEYKYFVKKNRITLQFEDPFPDSTTFTFNFFDGITDITEKNPPENLIIAFSTGDFIDSLKISGSVKDLFTGKPVEKFIVGLFRYHDSLDLYKQKPTYFSSTNEQGQFFIQNIKYDRYKLLGYSDENKNLLFNAASESYAFKAEIFNPVDITDSIYLHSVKIDASPLNFISARPSGRYFEARYSKPLSDFRILDRDSSRLPLANIIGDQDVIRFYNTLPPNYSDSLFTLVESYDSLKNSRIDTLYVMFRESNRPPPEFSFTIHPSKNAVIDNYPAISVTFTKPVLDYFIGNFHIPIDTFYHIPVAIEGITSSKHQTRITLRTNVSKSMISDTLETLEARIELDSANPDTLELLKANALKRFDPNTITIRSEDLLFVSPDLDSITSISQSYKFPMPEDYGKLKINLTTDEQSYTVQLLATDKIYDQKENCNPCNFNQVIPGKYTVRILIDENQDGKWSPGNILQNIEPEPVHHFDQQTEVRTNWEIVLDISF